MYRLTFYPLGNTDCCLIELVGGKKVLRSSGTSPRTSSPFGAVENKVLAPDRQFFVDVVPVSAYSTTRKCVARTTLTTVGLRSPRS